MSLSNPAISLEESDCSASAPPVRTKQSSGRKESAAIANQETTYGPAVRRKMIQLLTSGMYGGFGLAILLVAWWLGGRWVAENPSIASFADFAPGPTFGVLKEMVRSGSIWAPISASLTRIGLGLGYACALGIPLGILIGRVPALQRVTNAPFQFLRMISPLSWMPIAVMVFATWEGAIVFLITAASIWPIIFSTINGISRIDPSWFAVAKNLGAMPWQVIAHVVVPAAAQDILTGVRLAMGVAWVILVPAEYLGVTSGLGYAINDARDTLEYDRLAAVVVVIGVCGYLIDTAMRLAIARVNWNLQEEA